MSETKRAPGHRSGTDFVKKLFQMLEENKHEDVVRWSDAGDSFIVSDTNEFTRQVLPNYFKHSNFSSFVRQLNKYDFHKVKLSQGVKQRYGLENVWEFKHPEFTKHNRVALDGIKRKVSVKNEGGSTGNYVSVSQFRALKDRADFLERDNQLLHASVEKLQQGLSQISGKYNSLVSTMLTSSTVNESFSNSISTLYKAVQSLGVQLPPVDLPVSAPLIPGPDAPQQQTGPPSQPQSDKPVLDSAKREERIQARPDDSALHVLLVEDDDVCITLCKKFLHKYGCTVVVVKDGLAAISAVEKVKFDLVLMDIVMPNLDGASATSVIRSFDSDTPIIAMTGNYQKEDLMAYLAHGMTDILAKPFTKVDLYMILEKHQMGNKLRHPSDSVSTTSSAATPIAAPVALQSSHSAPKLDTIANGAKPIDAAVPSPLDIPQQISKHKDNDTTITPTELTLINENKRARYV